MRILSQDLSKDIPYEQFAFILDGRDKREIIAIGASAGCTDSYFPMAKYSSIEKSKKAMEILRMAYTGTIFAQNAEMAEGSDEKLKEVIKNGFGIVSVVKDGECTKFEPLNICFKFPDDDEIEV